MLGHIQERVVDAYVTFRKAAEFIPADESGPEEGTEGAERTERSFASPEEVRAVFKT